MVLMNAPHWGGEGCQDSSCLLLSLPRRPVSACSVRRCWQECVFPWQKCNLLHTHNSTQCPLSSSWKWVQCCFPAQHPSLPSRERSARGPAPTPGTVARLGLGSPSCSPICSGLLGELCPWGSCWSPAHMQTFLSLHQSAYILASGFWCLFLCNAEIFNLFSYFI